MAEKEANELYEPYKVGLGTLIIFGLICFILICIIITSLYIYDYNNKKMRYNEAVQSDYIDVLEYNMEDELNFDNENYVIENRTVTESEYLKLKDEGVIKQ